MRNTILTLGRVLNSDLGPSFKDSASRAVSELPKEGIQALVGELKAEVLRDLMSAEPGPLDPEDSETPLEWGEWKKLKDKVEDLALIREVLMVKLGKQYGDGWDQDLSDFIYSLDASYQKSIHRLWQIPHFDAFRRVII